MASQPKAAKGFLSGGTTATKKRRPVLEPSAPPPAEKTPPATSSKIGCRGEAAAKLPDFYLDANPSEAGPTTEPAAALSRELQVHHVLKLLELRGECAAQEVRLRVLAGIGVWARGLFFDRDVLADALQLWQGLPAAKPVEGKEGEHAAAVQMKPASEGSGKASPGTSGRRPKRKASAAGLATASGESGAVGSPKVRALKASAGHRVPPTGGPRGDSCDKAQADGPLIPKTLRERLAMKAGTSVKELGLPGIEEVATPCRRSFGRRSPGVAESSPLTKIETRRSGARRRSRGPPSPTRADVEIPVNKEVGPAEKQKVTQAAQVDCRAKPDVGGITAKAAPEQGKSSKELKALLAAAGMSARRLASCVEKAELLLLWKRLRALQGRSLSDLQAECRDTGIPPQPVASECVRLLLEPELAQPSEPWLPAAVPAEAAAVSSSAPAVSTNGPAEASREVERILPLRRDQFTTPALWGFAVLAVTTKDLGTVQRAYRAIMRRLHPDKAGSAPGVAEAAEAAREAREACERYLSNEEAPGTPRLLSYDVLSSEPGSRRFKLHWVAPEPRESAPVRRYIIAALDPAYGRPLTVAILEPDWHEELRRFLSVEDLTCFTLAEKELQKMPSLWRQSAAVVQVAAANEAGQSSWATLRISLASHWAQSQPFGLATPPHQAPGSSGLGPCTPEPPSSEDHTFDLELRRRKGPGLRSWLEQQRKALLTNWLRSIRWPAIGTRDELVQRILYVVDGKTQA